jgi:hypothetical protein
LEPTGGPARKSIKQSVQINGGALVLEWHASLLNGAAREYRVTPPLDDPQLRVDPCGGDAGYVLASHVVPLALVLPNKLHHSVVAMLGSELACRRVDGAKAVACSGVNGPPGAIRLSLFNHVSTFRAFFYAAFLLEVFTKRERNLYAALRHPISRG